MLSPEQTLLLERAKASLQSQERSEQRAPCFGLHLSRDLKIAEHSHPCEPGREEQLFTWVVEQLEGAVAEGAICTALLVPLERDTGDTEGGVILDLQKRSGSRLVGVLPWTLESGELSFGEPTLAAKAAALFRAA